ncbi:DUF354 domain-containing protein [Halobacteria archaeon AArc-curdl1]|uniref:DUF354 domain-containing protein n=1 Tax=Natronosalvus hydrolyticus TaxID=2979988 RepID=A0AAP3E900_9EURY|nr:DUF354 domain-containing protein [Halobacteria archaeon AArc-curdl1]
MSILIQIAHPGHVHFFKNTIFELERKNVDLLITSRDKDITVRLLDDLGIDHIVLSGQEGRLQIREHMSYMWNTYNLVKNFQPEVITGVGGLTAAHVSAITNTKSYVFTDSENAVLQNKLAFPFADRIYTPTSYRNNLGPKQIRYPGYHELAYLHPDRFTPDKSVLESNGIDPNEKYSILRFVSGGAYHDIGTDGLSHQRKQELIEILSERGDVYISSEGPLAPEFNKFRLPVEPRQIHHLLSFADLYVGDSGTMATEAAVLGTPAIRYRSLDKKDEPGNFIELEQQYGLLYSMPKSFNILQKSKQILDDRTAKQTWAKKRSKLINDKIDVSQFVTETLEKSI